MPTKTRRLTQQLIVLPTTCTPSGLAYEFQPFNGLGEWIYSCLEKAVSFCTTNTDICDARYQAIHIPGHRCCEAVEVVPKATVVATAILFNIETLITRTVFEGYAVV